MANREIEKDYEEVFDLVYPQIGNSSNGILYKVIHILLETEESVADEICNRYQIKDNASLDDDENITAHLIEKPNLLLLFNNNWLKEKLRNNVMNPDIAKIVWIVIIACILVGVPYCIQYFNRKQNPRGNARKRQPDSLSSQPLPPITAALCLVVPASVYVDLRDKHPNGLEDNRLDAPDLKMLIDNASYFLCTTVEEAKSKEQFLERTNEEIPTNSSREVYIRINIDPGQEIIGKERPYILKRNLSDYGQRIIQTPVRCLKNLSGLEKFNRV